MKKTLTQIVPVALLQAAGLSIWVGLTFLNVGLRSPAKALLLLAGLSAIFTIVLTGAYAWLLRRKGLDGLSKRTFFLTALAALIAGVLLTLVSPIPRPRDPSNWQTIEITPLAAGAQTSILIEEIKLDGQPLSFDEIAPGPGWEKTAFGLQSQPGSILPLSIQRRGALENGVALLLGSGPDYGQASIRLGWQSVAVDTARAGSESQMAVDLAAPSQNGWAALYALGLALTGAAVLLLLCLLLARTETLAALTGRMRTLSVSTLFWIAAGFGACYFAFFFQPAFLSPSNNMQVENNLPAIYPIGNDLHLILNSAASLVKANSPYAGANKYPPLAAAFFTSLLGLNFREAFRIVSTANLGFFAFLTLGVPLWFSRRGRLESTAWILFAAGLFAYPLAFEVERGQFNLLAMALTFGALLLYHRAPKWKWLALAMFCLAVQLKIYPAIFVIFFTRDWRDWKRNLSRWTALGLANVLLLMALGWKVFTDFVGMMTNVVAGLGKSDWALNHSISGFVSFYNSVWGLGPEALRAVQIGLMLVVLGLLGVCLWSAVRRGEVLDPYLMLACTLAALTLPTLSNDYTLAFLIGPATLFMARLQERFDANDEGRWGWEWLLMAAGALALCGTFFSYYHKPFSLQNQFPALLILLVAAAVFSGREKNHKTHKRHKIEETTEHTIDKK